MLQRSGERPHLQLVLSGADRLLQLAGAVLMATFLVAVAATWSTLPAEIPVHFGLNGEPNRWGDRGEILLLPLIALLQFGLLSVLARFPHRHNYFVTITADNAERQYRLAARLLYVLNVLVVALLFALYLASWAVVNRWIDRLPSMLLWWPLVAISILLGWYLVRSRQAR